MKKGYCFSTGWGKKFLGKMSGSMLSILIHFGPRSVWFSISQFLKAYFLSICRSNQLQTFPSPPLPAHPCAYCAPDTQPSFLFLSVDSCSSQSLCSCHSLCSELPNLARVDSFSSRSLFKERHLTEDFPNTPSAVPAPHPVMLPKLTL